MSEDDDDLSIWTVPPPPDDLAERAALRALAPAPVVAREAMMPRRSGARTALLVLGASMGGAAIASAFWARLYFERPTRTVALPPPPAAVIPVPLLPGEPAEVTPIKTVVVSPAPKAAADPDTVHQMALEVSVAVHEHHDPMAISLAERVLAIDPGNEIANQNGALAACRLQDGELAKRYLAALHGDGYRRLHQLCIDLDVDVE